MTAAPLYSFPARMESLGRMLLLVRAAAVDAEPSAALRAETALEELLTNTVVHGGVKQSAGALVWLRVVADADVLRLHYEDACPAFDPRPKIEEALERTTNPMDQRPLGGLGLLMVCRLSDELHYQREHGRNCIDLDFRAGRNRQVLATAASAGISPPWRPKP